MPKKDDFLYQPPPSDDDFNDKFSDGAGLGDKWAAPEFGGNNWGDAGRDSKSHMEEIDSSPVLPGLNQPLGTPASGMRRMPSAPKAEGGLVSACASQIGIASFFGIMMGCASGAIIGPLSERV
jgi:hypothetical protein